IVLLLFGQRGGGDEMFMGWYDPDRKKPAREKLEEGIERYAEKFGKPPTVVLTNPEDAEALRQPSRAYPGEPALDIREARYVARWTYYLGMESDLAA
ncbi:MAG: hypothetical protein ACR2J8_10180, partial [Thermomicrobiales bacterium]